MGDLWVPPGVERGKLASPDELDLWMGIHPFIGGGVSLPAATAIWDAQAITGLTNGQAIATWTDSTGNGHTSVPGGGGASPPVYQTSGFNGHPTVLINTGGNAAMGTSAALAVNQPVTIAVVFKSLVTSGTNYLFCSGSVGPQVFTPSPYSMYAGSSVSTGVAQDTNAHLFVFVYNGASSSYSLDGAAPTTTSPGTNNMSGTFTIGAAAPNAGNFNMNAHFGEVRIYPAAFTPAQQSSLHATLAAKWGTP